MFVALVIVPFVIVHAHDVAAGPLAALPVEPAQTDVDAVIVGVAGFALIGTFVGVADAEQLEALVTVRFSVTLPPLPPTTPAV
jgi:hypothetical protein